MRIRQFIRPDVVLPLAGGIWLAVFGLRQVVAALLIVPSNATLERIQNLEPVTPVALVGLADRQSNSLAVMDSAAGWSNLGLALALQAESASAADRADLLTRTVEALRTSLTLAPANPYVWTRLAVVRHSTGARDAEIMRYVRLSWMTGPNEERLRLPRIGLTLGHWSAVTEADRQSLLEDIRHAWDLRHEDILPLATSPFATNVVRAALIPDLANLRTFEKALSAKRGQ
jgi:hypothetical protein